MDSCTSASSQISLPVFLLDLTEKVVSVINLLPQFIYTILYKRLLRLSQQILNKHLVILTNEIKIQLKSINKKSKGSKLGGKIG